MIETIHLAHMPANLAIYATVFRNVENTAFLKEQLLAGNQDFEYAFVDASTVLSRTQVLGAAFRACNDYIHHRLKSHNIHSEIVFSLSPNNNIGEAFRRFGISDTTRDLVVLKVAVSSDITAESVGAHLAEHVRGEEQKGLEDRVLEETRDLSKIRKIYKVPAQVVSVKGKMVNGGGNTHQVKVDEIKSLESQLLGLMALRGAS